MEKGKQGRGKRRKERQLDLTRAGSERQPKPNAVPERQRIIALGRNGVPSAVRGNRFGTSLLDQRDDQFNEEHRELEEYQGSKDRSDD
jgi:hypothetical protein